MFYQNILTTETAQHVTLKREQKVVGTLTSLYFKILCFVSTTVKFKINLPCLIVVVQSYQLI
jgi:hypothetical protein